MTNQADFFPSAVEDTEDGKGRETKVKGIFTAHGINPVSRRLASKISGLEKEDLFPLLEAGTIHAFKRKAYGPGEAPLRYKDTPAGEALYEPLWPWEFRSIDIEDLGSLYFCRAEIGGIEDIDRLPQAKKETSAPPEYALCCKGDRWELLFKGEKHILNSTKGVRILANLLSKPSYEFHITELVEREQPECIDTGQMESEGLSVLTDGYTVPEQDEIKRLREGMQSVYDRFVRAQKTGKSSKVEETEKSFRKAERLLLDEYGLKTFVSKGLAYLKPLPRGREDIKKLQNSTRKAIKRVLKRIKELGDGDLHNFLKDSVHMEGTTLSYYTKGEATPEWRVEF